MTASKRVYLFGSPFLVEHSQTGPHPSEQQEDCPQQWKSVPTNGRDVEHLDACFCPLEWSGGKALERSWLSHLYFRVWWGSFIMNHLTTTYVFLYSSTSSYTSAVWPKGKILYGYMYICYLVLMRGMSFRIQFLDNSHWFFLMSPSFKRDFSLISLCSKQNCLEQYCFQVLEG